MAYIPQEAVARPYGRLGLFALGRFPLNPSQDIGKRLSGRLR
jgi:hypothetical protein